MPDAAKVIITGEDDLRRVVREELERLQKPAAEIMTRDEVAEMIDVHPKTVTTLVKREGLPVARRIGREYRFRRADVLAWIDRRGGRRR